MTEEDYTPLKRVIFFLGRLILGVIKISFLFLGLIAVPVLCVLVLLWWINDGEPENTSTQIFGFENYDELRAVSKSADLNTDKKTLRLSDSLSPTNFWGDRYSESIPEELLEEKTLVASSKWGGIDLVHTGLFNISQKSTPALIEKLNMNFFKTEQGIDTIQYKESELCLNITDLGNHSYWLVNNEKKKDFFEFCLNSRDVKKIKWNLEISKGENEVFSIISIIHYLGTPFFIVSHGTS